jgi:hypothetical protein
MLAMRPRYFLLTIGSISNLVKQVGEVAVIFGKYHRDPLLVG